MKQLLNHQKPQLSNIKVNKTGRLTRTIRPQYFLKKVDHSELVSDCFREIWDPNLLTEQEQIYVIYVDVNLNIIEWRCHFTGGLSETTVDLKVIFKYALNLKARGFFIAHNHPSGALYPSKPDVETTHRISKASRAIGIDFLDHVIITKDGYYSFYESLLMG